ncbi:integrase family protein [Opitutaceae bacterium TAV1]|nr:integrase family protein [Opitutaceae bacterium TAV1]
MISSDPTIFPERVRKVRRLLPTDPGVVAALVKLATEEPGLNLREITERMEREHGVKLLSPTVASLLQRHGVRTQADVREGEQFRQAEAALLAGKPVPEYLVRRAMKANPALRERERETRGPGERVCVAQLSVVRPGAWGNKRGRVWVHTHVAVDMYGGMAVAELYREATAGAAVAFLHERVLPFYRREGITLASVETSRGSAYYGGRCAEHMYGVYLASQGIRHEMRGRQWPEMNGFVERFREVFVSGFVKPLRLRPRRGRPANSERALVTPMSESAFYGARAKLAEWLRHYNEETPLDSYRNAGLTPRAFWQGAGTLNVEH